MLIVIAVANVAIGFGFCVDKMIWDGRILLLKWEGVDGRSKGEEETRCHIKIKWRFLLIDSP